MRDDFYSPAWASNHGRLSAAIHKLILGVGQSMTVLNRLQFSAPWLDQPRRRSGIGQ